MKRRGFIALVGLTATGFAIAPRAQPRIPTIGVLVAGNPDPGPFIRVFREALRDLGYVEGRTLIIELRSAGGKAALLDDFAAELVSRRVDVIVTWQTPAVRA